MCKKLKPLKFTWSCTSRVTTDYDTLKAMKDAGCRLLIVGYESGDQQILKNIKKGATIDMARALHEERPQARPDHPRRFHRRPARRDRASHCATPSISPKSWIPKPFRFRSRTPIPGTEFYDYAKKNGLINSAIDDGRGRPSACPTSSIPVLNRGELVEWVERFYDEYYFRPKAAWRVVRKAVMNGDVKRLYKEAREYLSLRSKRKKFVADQKASTAAVANGD